MHTGFIIGKDRKTERTTRKSLTFFFFSDGWIRCKVPCDLGGVDDGGFGDSGESAGEAGLLRAIGSLINEL